MDNLWSLHDIGLTSKKLVSIPPCSISFRVGPGEVRLGSE